MNQTKFLKLDFHEYWIAGTGCASSPWLDEDTDKADGLPFVSGRTLKGLLRDAVRCAEAWGWLDGLTKPDASWPIALFGSSTLETPGLTPDDSVEGTLKIGNADLPSEVRQYLLATPSLREGLHRAIFATAITVEGAASKGSLRGMEVNVPLSLEACIMPTERTPENWAEVLSRSLPLIRELGKRRTRGFGRATLTLASANKGAE